MAKITTDVQLLKHFKACGEIARIVFLDRDPLPKIAYIKFCTNEGASNALKLKEKERMLNGRMLRVEIRKSKPRLLPGFTEEDEAVLQELAEERMCSPTAEFWITKTIKGDTNARKELLRAWYTEQRNKCPGLFKGMEDNETLVQHSLEEFEAMLLEFEPLSEEAKARWAREK